MNWLLCRIINFFAVEITTFITFFEQPVSPLLEPTLQVWSSKPLAGVSFSVVSSNPYNASLFSSEILPWLLLVCLSGDTYLTYWGLTIWSTKSSSTSSSVSAFKTIDVLIGAGDLVK
jgi:hypothetical protein